MAFDCFLKIGDVKGESTDDVLKDSIEVYSFSFGASNPASIESGTGGGGAGRASISSFNVMKRTDKSSPILFQACCLGQHYEKAEVQIRKAAGKDGKQAAYLLYEFGHVFVDSIQWSGSSGGDAYPTESLSLSFGDVKIKYFAQEAGGKLATTPQQAGWSIVTNKAV